MEERSGVFLKKIKNVKYKIYEIGYYAKFQIAS